MAAKRFCRYLAEEYHLQKLANVSGKHLVGYVLYLQQEGKSASTVKTDLAAIRFFHDKISNPRYTLPANDELGVELERRRFGQKDRTWTPDEFARLLELTEAVKREDYRLALHLARYAGLRIHECFRLDTAAAENALRTGALTVKGKGGKVRTMPVTEEILKLLQAAWQRLPADTSCWCRMICRPTRPSRRCSSSCWITAPRSRTRRYPPADLPRPAAFIRR